MEEDQKQKHHVCKFCKKSYSCGRSLGGHMRSHMTANSAETEEKLNKKKLDSSFDGGNNSNTYMGFEAAGHVGYGLRENPKKTWRLSDSRNGDLQQEKVCKECGKGFQSWKALFGHMKCHSERVSNSLEDDSWTSANQKLVMDSQSDNEAAAPKRGRRSRRMRYKTTTTAATANGSSSVSEIEQEQEEVALCLMMLSRDVGYWGGLNFVAESSDNNSVVLETRSSCLDKRITKKEGRNSVCNGGDTVEMKKPRDKKSVSGVSDSENVQFGKKMSEFSVSDSGVLRDGVKKVELEVSVDGFLKDDEFKNPKLDEESGFEVSDAELGIELCNGNRLKCSETELEKDSIKKERFSKVDSMSRKCNSSKRTRFLEIDSCKKMTDDASISEIYRNAQKKNKYECLTCNKIFHSYQALGGHRASHKKIRCCSASRIENSENNIETEISPAPTADTKLNKPCSNEYRIDQAVAASDETNYGSKKRKRHECPICLKIFASGQALGGHKRSHLVGGSEARGSQMTQTIVIQEKLPEFRDLLDLNLPAPIEEDTDGQVGFKPWWVGSNHKHEALVGVGLISN
ncbi:hypothetical protein HHK36_024254 [Tetracentron sinense]|uniref:C2H2-type domain-containing protein n=1 Tax=Tetracentron sinense TaxID=13715 RepID=A0A834YKJ6_TETSI|nr:hypothetical protein HHK36_024254 [Tetracentron sinense]